VEKAKFEWLANSETSIAIEYLEAIQQRATMLQLYRHYYPDEYRESKNNTKFRVFEYSKKEIEFINLVNENFFPVTYLMIDSERVRDIPIEPLGTWWYYDEFDGLGVTEKFLMSLVNNYENDTWVDFEVELEEDFPIPTDRIDYSKLTEEAEKIEGMLSQFPVAVDVLTQSTGNIWLDITNESEIYDCEWKIEAIEILKESYKEAGKIMEQYAKFVEWLDQDAENCVKVVRLWNSCKKVITKTKEEAKYLIDVLEDY